MHHFTKNRDYRFRHRLTFSFTLNNCFFLAVTLERDGESIKVRLTDVGKP